MRNRFFIPATLIFTLSVLLQYLIAATSFAQGQSGQVYQFLNLPSTARITALGGYAVPTLDNDLGMALYYPSLIGDGIDNQLSLNFVDYFGDINYGTVAFSRGFPRIGNLTMSLQYINYGTFQETDEFGNTHGNFSAGEYAISFGWGRALNDKFSIGSNLKIITSNLEQYTSLGLATDISISYINQGRKVASSLVFRNIGRQVIKYHSSSIENLPFDIVFGISKKLINAPLRFSLVAHNLHIYDLTYPEINIPGKIGFSEQPTSPTSQERFEEISDKLLRHLVVGVEFLPTENFTIGIGYNYRRRQEMKVESRMSTVGLSWGIGVKISRFRFHYGRSNHHLAGVPNHFSISTNLEELFFKPNEVPGIR